MKDTIPDLAKQIVNPKVGTDIEDTHLRQAVVSAVDGNGLYSIKLGGSTVVIPGVASLVNGLAVDDAVWVTQQGSLLIIHGKIADDGSWTAYTPTLTASVTNPTLGVNGILIGAYRLSGKTLHLRVRFVFGSDSTAGNGVWAFALPTGLTSVASQTVGVGKILDAGTAHLLVVAELGDLGDSTIQLFNHGNTSSGVSHNNPIVWATGDIVQFRGTVEIA